MLPDLLSAMLRALGFLAVLQAGGAVLFLAVADRHLTIAQRGVHRLIHVAALAGIALLLAQYLLEPARMTGAISGMWDASLQQLVLRSGTAAAVALRLAGLVLLVVALRNDGARLRSFGVAGALLIAVSFTATGHTAQSPERWLLAPLLGVHLLVVEFWFGSLLPLLLVIRHESATTAAGIVQRFSRLATWSVPLILVAGVIIAASLLPDLAALRQPYGLGLALKVVAFTLLLGLAALNKWRWGPALQHGGATAARRMRSSIGVEFTVLAAVLLGTSTLTMFWSPGY